MTPLYVASERGYIEIVQVLLKAKASTDLANKVSFLMRNSYSTSFISVRAL